MVEGMRYEDEAGRQQHRHAGDVDGYISRLAVVSAIEDEVLLQIKEGHRDRCA